MKKLILILILIASCDDRCGRGLTKPWVIYYKNVYSDYYSYSYIDKEGHTHSFYSKKNYEVGDTIK